MRVRNFMAAWAGAAFGWRLFPPSAAAPTAHSGVLEFVLSVVSTHVCEQLFNMKIIQITEYL